MKITVSVMFEQLFLFSNYLILSSNIAIIAKIESIDSLRNLKEILQASDGAMVARGDLGAQIPLEQVPSAQ